MSRKPSRFKTTIDGKMYTIVGRQSQQHMQTVSELVNEELEELKKVTQRLTDEKRAMLLAINAKSEQLNMQKRVIELENKLARLSQSKSQDQ